MKDSTIADVRQAVLNGIVKAVKDQESAAAWNLAEVWLMLHGVDPNGRVNGGGVGFMAELDEEY